MSAEIRIVPGTTSASAPELEPDPPSEVADEVRRGDGAPEPSEDVQIDDEVREGFSAGAAAGAAGAGLAGRVRARRAQMLEARPRMFEIPGWDGTLAIEARPYSKRAELQRGVNPEKFVIGATQRLVYRDGPNDEWSEIPGRWGTGLAEMMGVTVSSASELVRAVFSRPVDGAWVENPAAVDGFAMQLIEWMTTASDEVDEQLGEG